MHARGYQIDCKPTLEETPRLWSSYQNLTEDSASLHLMFWKSDCCSFFVTCGCPGWICSVIQSVQETPQKHMWQLGKSHMSIHSLTQPVEESGSYSLSVDLGSRSWHVEPQSFPNSIQRIVPKALSEALWNLWNLPAHLKRCVLHVRSSVATRQQCDYPLCSTQ